MYLFNVVNRPYLERAEQFRSVAGSELDIRSSPRAARARVLGYTTCNNHVWCKYRYYFNAILKIVIFLIRLIVQWYSWCSCKWNTVTYILYRRRHETPRPGEAGNVSAKRPNFILPIFDNLPKCKVSIGYLYRHLLGLPTPILRDCYHSHLSLK